MKVLFLDIDGVLNSADWFHRLDPKVKGAAHELDPKPVARIKRVLDATGAVIVLSSTWRLVPELRQIIEATGLPIYDVTPSLGNGHRATEIKLWLDTFTYAPVEAFAIVDDDSDAGDHPDLKPRFVKTHWKHGLYGKHEKALTAMLSAHS